jgi:hypothetical protein
MKKLYQLNFKQSNWRKTFILVLWLIFIVIIAYPQIAKAEIKFLPQVKIPGFKETEIKEKTLAYYISSFYKWSVTAVAILAVIMIMISGLQWIFSAGNPPAIAKAKDQMMSAILGLILVLICIPLLKMINPALVRLSSFEIPEIARVEIENIDYKIYLPLTYWAPDISKGENRDYIEKASPSELSFCLYQPGGKLADDKSGTGANMGGKRSIFIVVYFEGKRGVENVAIKGYWGLQNSQNKFSLCKKDDGCGGGDDGWQASIRDVKKDECKFYGFSECTKVVLYKKDALEWDGKRGRLNDPDLDTQTYGDFEINFEILSKKNEFKSIKAKKSFAQTCGLLTAYCEEGYAGKNKCCKNKIKINDRDSYYLFCTASDRCPPGWDEEDDKYTYCGI